MQIGGFNGGFYNKPVQQKKSKEQEMLDKLNDAGKNIPLKKPAESDGPKPWINRLN